MLVEGVFNMHDHNKMNVTADFKRAAVNMKVFGSHHNGLLSISFIQNKDITNVFVNRLNTHNTTCMSIYYESIELIHVQMDHNEDCEVTNKNLHERMQVNESEECQPE